MKGQKYLVILRYFVQGNMANDKANYAVQNSYLLIYLYLFIVSLTF